MKLLIGTNNRGKVIEISEVLADVPVEITTPTQLNITDDPEETGTTYAENAELKARFFAKASGLPTIADDSGIVVEAIQNELGIHTRRWGAGPAASDEEWISYFLERMSHEENKRARFICTLAYVDESNALHLFEGRCDGVITPELEADYLPGLPISGCFKPDGYDQVFSALSLEQKNSTSHRGKATTRLHNYLVNMLN